MPGLGKTLLVRTLAKTLDLDFSRIQFTPDLMPADILGTNMVMETPEGKRVFEFQRGPIFTQICLADEINRATPKTQSAMLETMQEGSRHRGRHALPARSSRSWSWPRRTPSSRKAPIPLPEAQLDRFFFKLLVGYSDREELATIVDRTTRSETIEPVKVMDGAGDPPLAGAGARGDPGPHVQDYLVRLVLATHPERPVRPAGRPTSTSAGAPAPGPPRPWPWRPRSGRCWTGATTSASRTCAASSCRPCGTA